MQLDLLGKIGNNTELNNYSYHAQLSYRLSMASRNGITPDLLISIKQILCIFVKLTWVCYYICPHS